MKRFVILCGLCIISFSLFSQEKSRREIVAQLFNSIEEWFGIPYVLGGNTKEGIDCSGFVVNVYQKVFNKTLPRTVADQKTVGELVKGPLQPGDLVFFNINGTRVSHVGIYVFDGKFIHAASAGPEIGVIKSSLHEDYYKKRYVYARRIIDLPPYIKEEYEQNEKEPVPEVPEQTPEHSLTVATGRSFSDNRITEYANSFFRNSPLYLEIYNNSPDIKTITLEIAYQGNSIADKTTLTILPGERHCEFTVLDAGTYIIRLYAQNLDVVYAKMITVE